MFDLDVHHHPDPIDWQVLLLVSPTNTQLAYYSSWRRLPLFPPTGTLVKAAPV